MYCYFYNKNVLFIWNSNWTWIFLSKFSNPSLESCVDFEPTLQPQLYFPEQNS